MDKSTRYSRRTQSSFNRAQVTSFRRPGLGVRGVVTPALAFVVTVGCSLTNLDGFTSGRKSTSSAFAGAGTGPTEIGAGGSLEVTTGGSPGTIDSGTAGTNSTLRLDTAGTAGTAGAAKMAGAAGAAGWRGAGAAAGSAGRTGVVGAGGTTVTTTASEQCTGDPNLTGSSMRPQLTAAAAAEYTIANYLARSGKVGALTEDPWEPTPGVGDASKFVPTYTVAADGTGTHRTLNDALTAAAAVPVTSPPTRIFILLKPGTYREVVCVDINKPVTLYGGGADAGLVQIAFGNYAGKSVDASVNPCSPPIPSSTTYGPAASATLAINSERVQLKNLTITNDYAEAADIWAPGQQAVALLTQGDRIELENVRVLGNQFTTAFGTPAPDTVSRVYIKSSYVAGDVQFITGRATVVFDDSELHSVVGRVQMTLGSLIAATTAAMNPYGFLVNRSRITVDTISGSSWVLLGRSWDENVTEYQAGVSPNGQVLVRESNIAAHIKKLNPWGNALDSARVFDCHGNRLYEYANSGPGAYE